MTIAKQIQEIENKVLSKYACLSMNTKGRKCSEEECDLRTPFQRDRDRILHCKSFRRLKHKTQVFLSPQGDHYRTRLTHTLEVSQIARTIARCLSLNEDLTEAIALAHDLGHTPFGHAGERALNDIVSGGFVHYEQSVRVVEKLEKNGRGLNLTYEVIDGVMCHTRGEEAKTLEGRLVKIADRIAFINHDIDDAIRAKVLTYDDLPSEAVKVLGRERSKRIGVLILSIVKNSNNGVIRMDEDVQRAFDIMYRFMYDKVYLNAKAKQEEQKIPTLISLLFDYYMKHPNELPGDLLKIAGKDGLERSVCDHIAGMTDHFATQTFNSLFVPASCSI
jgi:dGTPase